MWIPIISCDRHCYRITRCQKKFILGEILTNSTRGRKNLISSRNKKMKDIARKSYSKSLFSTIIDKLKLSYGSRKCIFCYLIWYQYIWLIYTDFERVKNSKIPLNEFSNWPQFGHRKNWINTFWKASQFELINSLPIVMLIFCQ